MSRRKHRPSNDPTAVRASPSPASAASRRSAPAHPPRAAGATGVWLYGRHAVLAALANPRRRLERLLATAEVVAELDAAVAAATMVRPMVEKTERGAIESMLPSGAVHQGFAAQARPLPASELHDVLAEAGGAALLVVLDQVTDPRNVGAVMRSAQAFGAAAVIVQDRHAPEETGALAKAASGALEAVPLVRATNLARTLRVLRDAGFFCVGLAGDAETPLGGDDLGGPLVLVLGAEGSGLRRLVREACDLLVRIPIAPAVDSLNLSAAAAIALYACSRVRTEVAVPAANISG